MLTLIRVLSEALESLVNGAIASVDYFEYILDELQGALKETQNQLPELKKASVVDAGAKGFVHFVEGFIRFLKSGKDVVDIPEVEEEIVFDEPLHQYDKIDFRYCTEGLIKNLTISEKEVKKLISPHGDSLIVAGSQKTLRFHIHTNDPVLVFDMVRNIGHVVYEKVDDMIAQSRIIRDRKYPIALVTDSIADIPMDLIDHYQINVLPLNILYKDQTFIDRMTIGNEGVLSLDKAGANRPTSSQPELIRVKELYERLSHHYSQIIVISVAKALSGTYNVFDKASEEFREKGISIEVIDSKQNSAAQGLLVLQCAKMIDQGLLYQDIVTSMSDVIGKSKIYVGVKNLHAMIRSGRLSTKGGKIANIINLKPIVTLDESGNGGLSDFAFSFKGSLGKIQKKLLKVQRNQGLKAYCIVHINNMDDAKEYAKALSGVLKQEAEFITEVSSVVAIGAGEGAVAVGYITY